MHCISKYADRRRVPGRDRPAGRFIANIKDGVLRPAFNG